jgi:hypothetical protein
MNQWSTFVLEYHSPHRGNPMSMSVGIMFVDVNLAVTIACCLSGQPNQRVSGLL